MQFLFNALLALAAVPAVRLAVAQEAGPSPTNSYGCEPHGDHWHCEGAVTQTGAPIVASSSTSAPVLVVTTTTSTATSATTSGADHDHDDDEDQDHAAGTGSIAPSPTASVGCEPHGDHWHCDGPRTLTSVAPIRTISNNTITSTSTSTSAVAAGSGTTTRSSSLVPTGGASSLVGAGAVAGLLGVVGAFAL